MILLTTQQAIEVVPRVSLVEMYEDKPHRRVLFRDFVANEFFLYFQNNVGKERSLHGMVRLQGEEQQHWRTLSLPSGFQNCLASDGEAHFSESR